MLTAITAAEYAYSTIDQPDYEKVNVTDRGLVFRSSDNELIWMEVEGASDVLIDDALLPHEEAPAALASGRGKPGRPRRGATADPGTSSPWQPGSFGGEGRRAFRDTMLSV